MEKYIEKVLCLSTAHMPDTEPDWGSLRVAEHYYGFIVFVTTEGPVEGEPEWAESVMKLAREQGCLLIEFDEANMELDSLPKWDW